MEPHADVDGGFLSAPSSPLLVVQTPRSLFTLCTLCGKQTRSLTLLGYTDYTIYPKELPQSCSAVLSAKWGSSSPPLSQVPLLWGFSYLRLMVFQKQKRMTLLLTYRTVRRSAVA